MSGWISVEDRLPEENQTVLVFDGEEVFMAWQHNSFWFGPTWSDAVLVSHWMPLPEKPQ